MILKKLFAFVRLSSAKMRCSSSRNRWLSCSTTDAIPSAVSIMRNPASSGTKRLSIGLFLRWLRTTPRDATAFSDSNHIAMFLQGKA